MDTLQFIIMFMQTGTLQQQMKTVPVHDTTDFGFSSFLKTRGVL